MNAPLGAAMVVGNEAGFSVWAPFAGTVDVRVLGSGDSLFPLASVNGGYFYGTVEGINPGARYKYRLNGDREFPDPASRLQPDGVHGASEIVGTEFEWQDAPWSGVPLSDCIFYELHIGAFTPEGTFDAAIQHLDYLKELGVTAIEVMPVSQFPGNRNWGYDGVYPFAVQESYGGPSGLKRFVNAAHQNGLAVVLDVVYNHLGPEGNYLSQFGPYFTDRYQTPWGLAFNFDGEDGAAVRRFVIDNALQWVTEFHIDALRLDAVHAIFDHSPRHILEELAQAVHSRGKELGRTVHVIAESDLNDSRIVEPLQNGGYGLDAQWSDDFHHALHSLTTKERAGYYQDFGGIDHLAKAMGEGFVYSGQHSSFRGRPHGTSSLNIPAQRLVVCSQNHDQIGNRMLGERLSQLLEFEQLKLIAGVLLLSPFLPLLFMGQEYGEPAPFLYFVSHSDPDLIEAVRQGRRREFAAFSWQGEVPDAQAVETFERSRLEHSRRQSGRHAVLLDFYKNVIRIRKRMPGLKNLRKDPAAVLVSEEQSLLVMDRRDATEAALVLFHFGAQSASAAVAVQGRTWRKVLDSSDVKWMGPGSEIPEELTSDGRKLELRLPPHTVCVLNRMT
ncbi:MAG: malto-oligosyltrehalose trehalohydrolase [Candidatus Solibacter sp.]